MSKPYIHAQSSAKKFGGIPEEYIKFHEWFDQTKAHMPDQRHRAILHSSFGIYLLQQVFGCTFVNSVGHTISVRDIGEQHVLEDFKGKFIPTIQDYLADMPLKDWMNNGAGYPPSFQKVIDDKKAEKKKAMGESMILDGARGRPNFAPNLTTPSVIDDGTHPAPPIPPSFEEPIWPNGKHPSLKD